MSRPPVLQPDNSLIIFIASFSASVGSNAIQKYNQNSKILLLFCDVVIERKLISFGEYYTH